MLCVTVVSFTVPALRFHLLCANYQHGKQGLDCSSPGATTKSLPINPGYWRADVSSITIRECFNEVWYWRTNKEQQRAIPFATEIDLSPGTNARVDVPPRRTFCNFQHDSHNEERHNHGYCT